MFLKNVPSFLKNINHNVFKLNTFYKRYYKHVGLTIGSIVFIGNLSTWHEDIGKFNKKNYWSKFKYACALSALKATVYGTYWPFITLNQCWRFWKWNQTKQIEWLLPHFYLWSAYKEGNHELIDFTLIKF